MIIRADARPRLRPLAGRPASRTAPALRRPDADRLRRRIFGHLTGLRWLVAAGIALIFLGAFLFPLALNLTESTPPQLERLKNR